MDQVTVSIIVPVYNTQAYLAKCVDSILAQTFEDFELILVDDGSSDKSPEICDSYQSKDQRVKVIHKANGGPCSARNVGLEKAIGKYIYFVDSDDYIETVLLEKTVAIMEDQNSDWCCFGMVKEDSAGNAIEKVVFLPREITVQNEDERMRFLLKYLLNYRIGWEQCTHIFRGDIIRENRLFFEGDRAAFGEDLLFAFKYWLYAKSCTVIKDILYHYVQHENSLMWQSQFRNVLPEVHTLAKCAYNSVVNAGIGAIREDFAIIYGHLLEWHARPYVSQKGIQWVNTEIQKLTKERFFAADVSDPQKFYRDLVKRYGKDSGFVTVAIDTMSETGISRITECVETLLGQTLQKLDILILSSHKWELPVKDSRIRWFVRENPAPDQIVRAFFENSYGEFIYFMNPESRIGDGDFERLSAVLKYNECGTVIVTEDTHDFFALDSLYDRRRLRDDIRASRIDWHKAMFRSDLLENSGLSCMDNLEEYTVDVLLSGHTLFITDTP